MKPVMIEVAINGVTTKDRNPHVPISPQEIADESIRLIDAGAAIIHNHIEDIHLTGETAAARYGAGWAPVLAEHPDAILCPTAVIARTIEEKVAHLAPCALRGARMGSLDPGSLNLVNTAPDGSPGDKRFAYTNSFDEIDATVAALDGAALGPSIAIYEPGFLHATLAYHRAGKLPPGAMVKFYFAGDHDLLGKGGKPRGVPAVGFGLPPTRTALDAYLEMIDGSGVPWSVAVLGGDAVETGMVRLALERGGHVRIGLEDYGGKDTPTNLQLFEAALAECRTVGRQPATPREAARLLGLKQPGNHCNPVHLPG